MNKASRQVDNKPPSEEERDPLLRLTGLWRTTFEDNGTERTYLSGSLGAALLLIFPNDRKARASDPDYIAFLGRRRAGKNQPATTSQESPA